LSMEKTAARKQIGKESVRLVLRQVTARMKDQDEVTKDRRMKGQEQVWVMRQMTVIMRGQDEPTEKKDDKRSGVSVLGEEASDFEDERSRWAD
jgi:hypothetical protein